jgi:hypothetical protein
MTTDETSSSAPRWAKQVDDYGKRRWHRERRPPRRWEYIWTIIWNILFLYIVNKVPQWHLEFINGRYIVILWVLNANIAVHLGANLLMLILDMRWMRYLGKILMGAASFIMLMVLYYLNPFDFSQIPGWSWLDWFLPIFFIFGMVVSALSVLTNLWKLFFRWDR